MTVVGRGGGIGSGLDEGGDDFGIGEGGVGLDGGGTDFGVGEGGGGLDLGDGCDVGFDLGGGD